MGGHGWEGERECGMEMDGFIGRLGNEAKVGRADEGGAEHCRAHGVGHGRWANVEVSDEGERAELGHGCVPEGEEASRRKGGQEGQLGARGR
jgi:hypothetical protein